MFEKVINKVYQEKVALFLFVIFIISLAYKDAIELILMEIFRVGGFEVFKNYGYVEAVTISSIPQYVLLVYMFFRTLLVPKVDCEPLYKSIMKYWVGILFFLVTLVPSIVFSTDFTVSKIDFLILILWRLLPLIFISVLLIKYKKSYLLCLLTLVYSFTISSGHVFYQGLIQGNLRAFGWYYHPLFFAGDAITIELVCFCAILFKFFDDYNCQLLYLPLFVIWGAIIYNGSRGAWIAILCGFILIYMLSEKQYKIRCVKIVGILLLEAAVLLSLNTGIGKRVQSIYKEGVQPKYSRYLIWKSATNMFLDYPITGVGLGRFHDLYNAKYGTFQYDDSIRHAHNDYLHMLAENGIVGFCGFVTMFAVICWKHWKKLQQKFNPYSVLCLATVVTFLVHGLTEYNFAANAAVVMIMWLVVSILTVLAEWDDCFIEDL